MKTSTKIISLILCLVMVFAFAACSSDNSDTTTTTEAVTDATTDAVTDATDANTKVVVTVKDFGQFTIELYPEYAPKSVENFISLVKSGFYSGTIFHRVMEGFMAQGGAPANGENLTPIKGEFKSNGWDANTLLHTRGVISMARTTDPDSATSQFFICYDDCPTLDGDYAAFGKVIEGMEVVDKFLEVEKTYNSRYELAVPIEDIVIEKMEIAG
ncbi:MAG: peptidylprolyl isomerase [Clostridia bacterium]|nr:peptidylprolyl isomerase [Clostridia bacterium]